MKFMLNFFDNGNFLEEVNMTWVVLIPKVDDAMDLRKFRPISMWAAFIRLYLRYWPIG